MKPEGAFLSSQELAIGPCPEPDESSLYLQSYFNQIHFNIVIPTEPLIPTIMSSERLSMWNEAAETLLREPSRYAETS
jgi:hypothetical protein